MLSAKKRGIPHPLSPLSLTDFPTITQNCIPSKLFNLLLSSSKSPSDVEQADRCRDSVIEQLRLNLDADSAALNQAYAASSVFYAQALIIQAENKPINIAATSIDVAQALRAIDLGVLRGGVEDWGKISSSVVERGEALLPPPPPPNPTPPPQQQQQQQQQQQPQQYLTDPCASDIPRIDAEKLSPANFKQTHLNTSTPVIITNAINSWPATTNWGDLNYLKSKAGGRIVPIETCASADASQTYLSSSFDRRTMSLTEYIEEFVENENPTQSDRGYLAQYQLFDQIPSLRDDITNLPQYTSLSTREDDIAPSTCEKQVEPIVSAWFGRNTVSPLHNDPYHNLLVQVSGTKYIRLYAKNETGRLYPREGPECNNSEVDIDNVDQDKFPLFKGTQCLQCILAPGEVLYIPRHFWHYVRSLGVSFSTSFWWGARLGLIKEKGGGGGYKSMY